MTIDCSQDSALTADVLEDIRSELSDKLPELRPSKRANVGPLEGPKDALVRARPKKIKSKVLPEKEFKARPSLMTRMLALEDYAGLYNIFATVVINLTLYMIVADLYETGSVNLGMANVCAMFGQPLVTWSLLILMHSSSAILFYWTFRAWADNRASFLSMEGVWDLSFSIMLVLFVYGFYYIPIQVHWSFKLPPASAAIIVLEQLRLTMKLYAFTRSNVPRVLKSCEDEMNYYFQHHHHHYSKRISHGDGGVQAGEDGNEESDYYPVPRNLQLSSAFEQAGSNGMGNVLPKNQRRENLDLDAESKEKKAERSVGASPCPEFEHFLYFLYAPTLVYRDSYPRTERIRWGFVAKNVVELIGCIYMYNIIHHLTGYVLIEKFGASRMPRYDLIRFIFFQMITGGLGFILGFFILLQTTQNIGAELLRFGDRQFYLDWWNSDSFGAFYRKWNLPVQDFLYTYIYKEAKEANLDQVSRIFPSILVFLISSIFHEYVLMFVLQVCYPLLLFLFGGFGMALSFIPNTTGSKQRGNLFFWWSLITGNGLIHAFYMLEYFARANGCPPAESPIKDFFLPRSWTCGAIGP